MHLWTKMSTFFSRSARMSSLDDVLSTSAPFFRLPPSETLGVLVFLDSGFSDVWGTEFVTLHLESNANQFNSMDCKPRRSSFKNFHAYSETPVTKVNLMELGGLGAGYWPEGEEPVVVAAPESGQASDVAGSPQHCELLRRICKFGDRGRERERVQVWVTTQFHCLWILLFHLFLLFLLASSHSEDDDRPGRV